LPEAIKTLSFGTTIRKLQRYFSGAFIVWVSAKFNLYKNKVLESPKLAPKKN